MVRETDNGKIWRALCEARHIGVHSRDIRVKLESGNPSQRIIDIERARGISIPRRDEPRKGRDGRKRAGVRYWHPDFAPADLGDAPASPGRDVAELSGARTPAEAGSDSSALAKCEDIAADPGRDEETTQLGLLPQAPPIYTDDAA